MLPFREERLQINPYDEWTRRICPPTENGFISTDIDNVIRRQGKNFNLDSLGDVLFIEETVDKNRKPYPLQQLYRALTDPKRRRGAFALRVLYTRKRKECNCCGKFCETPDEAFKLFESAILYLSRVDDKDYLENGIKDVEIQIDHETLREFLVDDINPEGLL